MNVGAIVQARMSSNRFPGKVLAQVEGKPLLGYLLERLERCQRLDGFRVATSTEASDDPVFAFCRKRGVACHRGELVRVSHRFKSALEEVSWKGFVRISGDSPLLDPDLVDQAVGLFEEGHPMVTNVLTRSYPVGQSVEVLDKEFYLKAMPQFTQPEDFEHVTHYFYRNADRFRIRNFQSEGNFSRERLCVDTAEDLERIRSVVRQMKRPHWEYGWRELLVLAASGKPA